MTTREIRQMPSEQLRAELPNVGNDRLLTIGDVSRITGLCAPVASDLIKETGRAINVHRCLYILESSFLEFLKEQEQRTSQFLDGR